jgi:hypothetical protein
MGTPPQHATTPYTPEHTMPPTTTPLQTLIDTRAAALRDRGIRGTGRLGTITHADLATRSGGRVSRSRWDDLTSTGQRAPRRRLPEIDTIEGIADALDVSPLVVIVACAQTAGLDVTVGEIVDITAPGPGNAERVAQTIGLLTGTDTTDWAGTRRAAG